MSTYLREVHTLNSSKQIALQMATSAFEGHRAFTFLLRLTINRHLWLLL